jgi:hypothetical protein
MAKKRKLSDDEIKLEDVHTLSDQIAYSQMLSRKWEAMSELPSAIWDFPMPVPGKSWTHPEFAAHIAQRQKKKRYDRS